MKIQTLIVCSTLLAPGLLLAQEPDVQKELKSLRERIDELEDQQAKMAERVGGTRALATAYTATSLDFGGHVTSLFTYIKGESESEYGHAVSVAELFVKAQLDDQWSLFATPGFYTFNGALLDNPASPTAAGDPSFTSASVAESSVFLTRVLAQWRHSDMLTVQGGIIGSPHGITNREYFIPARSIAAGSLHTRYFTQNNLYPTVLEGFKTSGKFPSGQDSIEYDLYFGVEPDSASDGVYGARLAYAFSDLGLTIAANYGGGTREALPTAPVDQRLTNFPALQAPFAASFNAGRDYDFGGIDIELRSGDLMMRSELYYSAEENFIDQRAVSTEWTWWGFHPKWGVSYRFDYFDSGSDFNVFAGAVLPRGHATEHVVGVNFYPNASVRLRLDYHHLLLPNTDDTVDYLNLSWSVSF